MLEREPRQDILSCVTRGEVDKAIALITAQAEPFEDDELHASVAHALSDAGVSNIDFEKMLVAGLRITPKVAHELVRFYMILHRYANNNKKLSETTVLMLLQRCKWSNVKATQEEWCNLLAHMLDVGEDKFSETFVKAIRTHCDNQCHWVSERLLMMDFSPKFGGCQLYVAGTNVTRVLPELAERHCDRFMPAEVLDAILDHLRDIDEGVDDALFRWTTRMSLPERTSWLVQALYSNSPGLVDANWIEQLEAFEPSTDDQRQNKPLLLRVLKELSD